MERCPTAHWRDYLGRFAAGRTVRQTSPVLVPVMRRRDNVQPDARLLLQMSDMQQLVLCSLVNFGRFNYRLAGIVRTILWVQIPLTPRVIVWTPY